MTGPRGQLVSVAGAAPAVGAMPPGCPFAPRCPLMRAECDAAPPPLRMIHDGPSHRVSRTVRLSPAGAGRMSALVEAAGLTKHFMPRGWLRARSADARRGRRRPLDHARRDARSRRRVGLRQVDHRPAAAAADRAERGRGAVRGGRHRGALETRDAPDAQPHADRVPGSVRFAQSAADGRRDRDGGVRDPRGRIAIRAMAPRGRNDRPGAAATLGDAALPARILRRPAAAHRHRTRARAAAILHRVRRSRSRRSTSRCRRRSSTCCRICSASCT